MDSRTECAETVHVVPDTPAEDSLKKRYAYKLTTNLVVFGISLLTAGIIPRGLGPRAYGEFSFLNDFFSKVVAFFDTGTSLGFFAKISQRRHEHALIRFYWGFVAFASVLLVLAVGSVFLLNQQGSVWPEQQVKYVWLALFLGQLTWFSANISKLVDAFALTARGELVRMSQKVIGAILLFTMFWLDRFSLVEFFIYQYVMVTYLVIAWARVLKSHGVPLLPPARLTLLKIRGYISEFYNYSSPLLVYALVGLIVGIFDRWILQKFAGSTEQGFYGLSYNVSTICFLFTSAMTPLFMREFSVAFGGKERERMRHLMNRYLPMLFAVTAYLAVFVSLQADKVSLLLGGDEFKQAGLAVGIMAFYPIHQTFGQLTGSVFYATEQTRVYRNIGIVFMALSPVLMVWLTAPRGEHGLALGATGLAIKMVALQCVWTNALLWYLCRYLQLPFKRFLFHQLYSLGILAGCAMLAVQVTNAVVPNILANFILSGVIYTLLTAGLLLCLPSLFSFNRRELNHYLQKVREGLRDVPARFHRKGPDRTN